MYGIYSMENPLLSIVTPVYNVATYLTDSLRSILQQEFRDFELILIDDGSTDGSGAICDEFGAQDDRIRIVHQANGGLSVARNTGIALARGAYITFVDSDDTISPDLYLKNMKILHENPSIDLIEFPVFVDYGSPKQRLWRKGPHHYKGITFEAWFKEKGYNHMYAWNKIFRRNLFDEIRFPAGKLYEDIYTIPLILKKCSHYFLSDQGIYYYHASEGSISRTRSFEQYSALFDSNYQLWREACRDRHLTTDCEVFSLNLADWLISMGRTDMKQTRRLIGSYEAPSISLGTLLRLPVPLSRKIKNLPLALFGRKVHCMIYSLIK